MVQQDKSGASGCPIRRRDFHVAAEQEMCRNSYYRHDRGAPRLGGGAPAADPARRPTVAVSTAGSPSGLRPRWGGPDFGPLTSAWSRFTLPTADDNSGTRTLAYGGYRWANDVAVEAALATLDRYALRPP